MIHLLEMGNFRFRMIAIVKVTFSLKVVPVEVSFDEFLSDFNFYTSQRFHLNFLSLIYK